MVVTTFRAGPRVVILLAVLLAACRGGAGAPPTIAGPGSPPALTLPSAPAVDLAEVLDYARRASAAYGDETAIRAAVGPAPTLTVANLPGVDVRAFVEVDEARHVQWVAVRGTSNLENAAEDADYTKVLSRDLGIPVHVGFLDDARAVWSFARPLLRPGLETRITGHSLGGALAVLLAMRLRVDGLPLGHVITFGQPKVTTEEGVARFRDLPVLRVVNDEDPVPLLPWETPGATVGGFYRHLGQELHLTSRGTFDLFPEHRAEGFLLTSFVAHLGREIPKEHEIARYLGRIETLLAPHASPGGPR
jgi:triacylglycerol lipase